MKMIQDKIYSYFDGNPQLHALFVFDGMGGIRSELEGLEWRAGYRLEVFGGDWFTVKYNLTNEWKEDKVILVFIGMTEPSRSYELHSFPLYGEMKANMVFCEENYVAFMQLKGIKPDFAPFISRHIAEMQLSKYDRILSDYYKSGVFSVDICNRALISGYMGMSKLLSWEDIIIRLTCLCGIESEADKRDTFLRLLKNNADALAALSDIMMSIAGYPFDIIMDARMKRFAESFKYNAITQGIPAVSADDYKNLKIDDALVLQRLNSLMEYATGHSALSGSFIQFYLVEVY